MVEGLVVTLTGENLVALCRKYADQLDERATKVEGLASELHKIADVRDVSYSNRPVERQSADSMRNEARELRFIADHIDVSETYRLDRDDLRRLGIVKGF